MSEPAPESDEPLDPQGKAIADYRFNAGCGSTLLSTGAWALGLRALAGLPLWQACAWAATLALLTGMLLKGLGGGDRVPPRSVREKLTFVQPWLIAVAFQGSTIYWIGRSVRLSGLTVLLGLGFTLLHWPGNARVEAWRKARPDGR